MDFIASDLPDHFRIRVILPEHQSARLAKTCFRGKRLALAGNTRWDDFGEMMHDDVVFKLFSEMCRIVVTNSRERHFTESFEISHPSLFVGWESTNKRERFTEPLLEPFKPNKHSRAMRVRTDCMIPAPLSDTLTFVCAFTCEPPTKQWRVIIHSIYPGHDVGNLEGDITTREGIVFYDWKHPGEPLP